MLREKLPISAVVRHPLQ